MCKIPNMISIIEIKPSTYGKDLYPNSEQMISFIEKIVNYL